MTRKFRTRLLFGNDRETGSDNMKESWIGRGGWSLRDTRPLAVRGQPEVREHRARFLDGTTEISGDGSPVERVTVSG
jgi:hypothetical protein